MEETPRNGLALVRQVRFEAEQNPDESCPSIVFVENPENPLLLKYADSKSEFLTRVSIVFIVYALALNVVIAQIFFHPNQAREWYRLFFLNFTHWILMFTSIVFKLLFFLKPEVMRSNALSFFVVMVPMDMAVVLGFYFEIDNFIITMYVYNGHYLIILLSAFLVVHIMFYFSTMLRTGSTIFSPLIGTILMSLASAVLLRFYYSNWPENLMSRTRYVYVWLITVVYNYYICRNAYLIVNCRSSKFFQSEIVFCFICFFTDWIYNFWFDVPEKSDSQAVREKAQLIRQKCREFVVRRAVNQLNSGDYSDDQFSDRSSSEASNSQASLQPASSN